jgi:polyphosphate kinase
LIPVGPRPASGRSGRAAGGPGPRRVETLVWVEDVIAANLDALFPGMTVLEAYPFHVTRDADMVIQELEAEDLLETIEQGVRARQFGSVTRLKVPPAMPARTRELLVENLEMDPRDVYVLEAPLALAGLMGFYGASDRWDLKDVPFKPALPRLLDPQQDGEDDIFGAIRQGDILLHHPYDSFLPVVDFLKAAAQDPDVLAIKQTLYRVGRNSPVVEALLEAREEDKQVAVLVELKARFDEESNISWARKLEAEGTHVIYGLLGLKTHGKVALVVRREGQKLRRYVHLSTGNYNTVTANLYTDIGYFTCDPEIGEDVSDLFNTLTGYSAKRDYRKLLVAPINLRERMAERIEREIAHARRGEPARLIFKVNALLDRQLILQLYRASQAGVQVDLLVRGICCLKPGVPGLSENIRVISTLGRFLEHSRIFWFGNGGEEEVLLGSADLMPRNLDRRVEVLFPVQDPRWARYLKDEVLEVYLRDNLKARRMRPDGGYERVTAARDEAPFSAQAHLLAVRGGTRR